MSWVVGLVWGIAVLIGIVVLGLCAFDLRWKAKRLSTDAEGLRTLQSRLVAVQEQAADVAQRLPSQLNQPGR